MPNFLRNTTQKLRNIGKNIGNRLALEGFVLRSGGADGADTFFEIGCDMSNGLKEIYLPWNNFNNNLSQLILNENNDILV